MRVGPDVAENLIIGGLVILGVSSGTLGCIFLLKGQELAKAIERRVDSGESTNRLSQALWVLATPSCLIFWLLGRLIVILLGATTYLFEGFLYLAAITVSVSVLIGTAICGPAVIYLSVTDGDYREASFRAIGWVLCLVGLPGMVCGFIGSVDNTLRTSLRWLRFTPWAWLTLPFVVGLAISPVLAPILAEESFLF